MSKRRNSSPFPVAFHSVALHQLPLCEAIATVATYGYEGIELNAETLPWAAPHLGVETSPEERKAIRAALLKHGLVVSCLCAHIPLAPPDRRERQAALAYSLGCIDLARDLGCGVIHGLSGVMAPGQDPAEVWETVVQTVTNCVEYAAARQIKYAFEAIAGMVVCDTASLTRLLKAVPGLYVNYDPSHFAVAGDDLAASVAAVGSRIVHCHVKDAKGAPDRYEFPPLGQGRIDFRAFFGALKAAGYSGFVSVEYEANVFGYQEEVTSVCRSSLEFICEQARGGEG